MSFPLHQNTAFESTKEAQTKARRLFPYQVFQIVRCMCRLYVELAVVVPLSSLGLMPTRTFELVSPLQSDFFPLAVDPLFRSHLLVSRLKFRWRVKIRYLQMKEEVVKVHFILLVKH